MGTGTGTGGDLTVKGGWFDFPDEVYRLNEDMDEKWSVERRSEKAWNFLSEYYREEVTQGAKELGEAFAEMEKERVRADLEKRGIIKDERVERKRRPSKRVGKISCLNENIERLSSLIEDLEREVEKEKREWEAIEELGKREFVREKDGHLYVHIHGKKYMALNLDDRGEERGRGGDASVIRCKVKAGDRELEGYIEENAGMLGEPGGELPATVADLLRDISRARERMENDRILGECRWQDVRVSVWRDSLRPEQSLICLYVLCALRTGIRKEKIFRQLKRFYP